jgi:hypothetical protein
MRNKLYFLVLCAFMSLTTAAQTTYLADTAFTTDIGFGGAPASCVFGGGEIYGWQFDRTSYKWVANAFTVPADSTWTFDTVVVYGYQAGSGTTSTFTACNLEIYNGAPGLTGSVIWGDTTTNVMAATDWTGMYRVDSDAAYGGLTQTTRPIMYLKLHLSPAVHLSAGTYWLACSATGSLTGTTSTPSKVLPGRINPTGQQERQLLNGSWNTVSDNGHNAGMNMVIKASAAALGMPVVTNTPVVSLGQNVPNPFSETTTISFYVTQPGFVKLSVYNVIGQLVATPVTGDMDAGNHQITFDRNGLPCGTYYYQLQTAAGNETKQMILVK